MYFCFLFCSESYILECEGKRSPGDTAGVSSGESVDHTVRRNFQQRSLRSIRLNKGIFPKYFTGILPPLSSRLQTVFRSSRTRSNYFPGDSSSLLSPSFPRSPVPQPHEIFNVSRTLQRLLRPSFVSVLCPLSRPMWKENVRAATLDSC